MTSSKRESVRTIYENTDYNTNNKSKNNEEQCSYSSGGDKSFISTTIKEKHSNYSIQSPKFPDQIISDIQKLIKLEIKRESGKCRKYLKQQCENFKNEMNEMFVRTKFDVISEFAKFEQELFENIYEIYLVRDNKETISSKQKLSLENNCTTLDDVSVNSPRKDE